MMPSLRSHALLIAAAALLVPGVLPSVAAAGVIPDVLYVQMEEPYWDGTPDQVQDSSGMGHDGTAGTAASVYPGGYLGQAGQFTVSPNSYLNFGTAASLVPTQAMTLEAWVRPKDMSTWATNSGIVTIRTSGYYLRVDRSGQVGAYFKNGSSDAWLLGGDITQYGDSWSHLVARYDPTAPAGYKETVWLNGVIVAHQDNGTGNIYNSGIATAVGYDPSPNHYWGNYKGLIDEAGIYDYALSDAEIIEHAGMRGTVHRPDVLYYRMEEPSWNGTPGEVMDWSYSGHPGTATGEANVDPNGWFRQAGRFDGSGDSIDVGNSLDLVPTSKITLAAWIKPDDLAGWTHDGCVIGRPHSYYLEVAGDGHIRFYLYGVSGAWLDGPSLLSYGDDWLHVAATYDGSEKAIFVNGIKVASEASAGSIAASTADRTYIGYVDSTRYFTGLIDEAAIFSWALSEDQILARSQYVPEPASAFLGGLALVGLGLFVAGRRRGSSRRARLRNEEGMALRERL